MNKFELEERLVKFSIQALNLSDTISNNFAGSHLSKQLIGSGTAPALNYAEAISAESRKDFVHKMKIALKELRETIICIKIIKGKSLTRDLNLVSKTLSECNELISIFVTSIKTARDNDNK